MYQCQHPKRCNAQKDVIKVLESVREWVGVESSVNREAIEQRFTSAGWKLDGSFSEYLIIGCNNDDSLSILAYAQAREPEDSVFELIDHERDLTERDLTRGISPMGSSKYRPPIRPGSYSRSTAS